MKFCLCFMTLMLVVVYASKSVRLEFENMETDKVYEYRQALDRLNEKRVLMVPVPQIPIGAQIHSWTWSLSTPLTAFPSWCQYVAPWPGSDEFALNLRAPGGTNEEIRTAPDPVNLVFTGQVRYFRPAHGDDEGPGIYTLDQKLTLKVSLFINSPTEERLPALRTIFNATLVDSRFPFTSGKRTFLRNFKNDIGSFSLQSTDTLVLDCQRKDGDDDLSQSDYCLMCDTDEDCELHQGSFLDLASGVLVMGKGFKGGWGRIRVREGATMEFDVPPDSLGTSQPFLFRSGPENDATGGQEQQLSIENNGLLLIKNGHVQIESQMEGRGRIQVEKDGILEFNTGKEALSSIGEHDPLEVYADTEEFVIENLGSIKVTSGRVKLLQGMRSIGGDVEIGPAGAMDFDGHSLHLFGGDSDAITGLHNRGLLHVENAKVKFSRALRSSGLVDIEQGGEIEIDHSSSEQMSEFGGTGLGLSNQGLLMVRGGKLKISADAISHGPDAVIAIAENGYLEFDSPKTGINGTYIGGQLLSNAGQLVVQDGTLQFLAPLYSSGSITATPETSGLDFFSTNTSIISKKDSDQTEAGLNVEGTVRIADQSALQISPLARGVVRSLEQDGSLVLGDHSLLQVQSFEQTSPNAHTSLNYNGVLQMLSTSETDSNTANFRGGVLSGYGGVVKGDMMMTDSTVSPGASPGELIVQGDFRLTTASNTNIEITGAEPVFDYDRIRVTSKALLNGHLQVNANLNFIYIQYEEELAKLTPDTYAERIHEFEIITAQEIGGKFQTVSYKIEAVPENMDQSSSPDITMDIEYRSTKVVLVAFVHPKRVTGIEVPADDQSTDQDESGVGDSAGSSTADSSPTANSAESLSLDMTVKTVVFGVAMVVFMYLYTKPGVFADLDGGKELHSKVSKRNAEQSNAKAHQKGQHIQQNAGLRKRKRKRKGRTKH